MKNKPSILALSNHAFILSIILILVMGSAVAYYFIKHTHQNDERTVELHLNYLISNIDSQLAFYQSVVDAMATRDNVKWILTENNSVDAEQWALKQRKFLPNAIGLALVDEVANLLGNNGALRVGPTCQTDLKAHLDQGGKYQPRVHKEIEHLEHFDIVSDVYDESNEKLGLVFASFSVKALEKALHSDAQGHEHIQIALYDDQHEIIIGKQAVDSSDLIIKEARLTDSNWSVRIAAKPSAVTGQVLNLFFLAIIIAIVSNAILIALSRKQVRNLTDEFRNINDGLKAALINDNRYERVPARYRETEAILPLIQSLSQAIRSKQKYLYKLSETDPLTSLSNRRAFESDMQDAWLAAKTGIAVYLVYLDLDHFKEVNDVYGHEYGDQLLKSFADCLRENTRANDKIIRMGGDEFVVFIYELTEDGLLSWYQRISQSFIEKQGALPGGGLHCGLSAGAAAVGISAQEMDASIQMADKALYTAKNTGRGKITIYSESLDS